MAIFLNSQNDQLKLWEAIPYLATNEKEFDSCIDWKKRKDNYYHRLRQLIP